VVFCGTITKKITKLLTTGGMSVEKKKVSGKEEGFASIDKGQL